MRDNLCKFGWRCPIHLGRPSQDTIGYSARPREITIREDAPENLRYFILDTAIHLGFEPHALREDACAVMHTRPNPYNAHRMAATRTEFVVFKKAA